MVHDTDTVAISRLKASPPLRRGTPVCHVVTGKGKARASGLALGGGGQRKTELWDKPCQARQKPVHALAGRPPLSQGLDRANESMRLLWSLPGCLNAATFNPAQ